MMKAIKNLNGLRAWLAFVVFSLVLSFHACDEKIEPDVPFVPRVPTVVTNAVLSMQLPSIAEIQAIIRNNGGSPLTEAGVCWDIGRIPDITSNKVLFDITGGELGDFVVQVPELQAGIVYRFRAYAINKVGTAYGEPKPYYYTPDIVIDTTTTITYEKAEVWTAEATEVTLTSAKLNGLVIPKEPDTELVFEIAIPSLSEAAVFTQIPVEGRFSGNDTIRVSVEAVNLSPAVEYIFRLRAINPHHKSMSEEDGRFETYAVIDYDGNMYRQVKIGEQIWLTSNLKTTHFANGDPIPNVKDPKTWSELTTGAYVWYNHDPKLGEEYGALYNFYVGADSRPLIEGWHVATHEEWYKFRNSITHGIKTPQLLEQKFWSPELWSDDYSKLWGFNLSGFSARPAGAFFFDKNTGESGFYLLDIETIYWSSEKFGSFRGIATIVTHSGCFTGAITAVHQGFSIRLIKN